MDEADLFETDGNVLYQVRGQTLTVVDITDSADLQIVDQGRLPSPWLLNESLTADLFFPEGGPAGGWSNIDGIFLQGDRLTVISSGFAPDQPFSSPNGVSWQSGQSQVQVSVLDVSNPSQVSILETAVLEGNLVTARAIEDQVYVVTNSDFSLPAPQFIVDPFNFDFRRETEAEYLARVDGQVLDLALPNIEFRTPPGDVFQSGLLTAPTDIYTPFDDSFFPSLYTLSTFDTSQAGSGNVATSLPIDFVDEVFVSANNLYLLQQQFGFAGDTTQIWQINLATSELVAIGEVPGRIDSRFSVDEHEGFLRITTTTGFGLDSQNNVYVLEQSEDTLEIVGSIEGLAPGERVFSARFEGDIGFVVTFREVDPLFTLDLSDPTNPQVLSELKVPGFSEYLQFVEQGDQDLLIGIGLDADPNTGFVEDLKVSLFDVTDLSNPFEVDSFIFDGDFSTNSDALWDNLAVNYIPNQELLAIPTSTFNSSTFEFESTLTVFDIDGQAGISRIGTIAHEDGFINRSRGIREDLFAVSGQQVSAHDVPSLDLLSEVTWTSDEEAFAFLSWSEPTGQITVPESGMMTGMLLLGVTSWIVKRIRR